MSPVIPGPIHMEHMASHSLTRLYTVVSKAVTEETLEYLFGVFEGLEYVDLKRDHASGLSRVSPVSHSGLLLSKPESLSTNNSHAECDRPLQLERLLR